MKANRLTNRLRWIWLSLLVFTLSAQPIHAQGTPTDMTTADPMGQEDRSSVVTQERALPYRILLPIIQQQSASIEQFEHEDNAAITDTNGTVTPDQATEAFVPLRDGEVSVGSNAIIATITLENRTILRFVQFDSGDIALLEEAPVEAPDIRSIPGLDTASTTLAEVFYAFSEPDTLPPPALQLSDQQIEAKQQGWARALVNDADQSIISAQLTSGNCNNTSLQNWIVQFGYNDRGTPNFRLNQTPRTSAYFMPTDYIPGNGYSYDFYQYTVGGNDGSIWYDVDRYASRVAVCAIDGYESANPGGLAHPAISYQGYTNSHMGPVVSMMYRRPGETVWHTATAKDFAANEVGQTLSWHFYTGNNWDWSTRIYWAGADDSFDIGHAVEDL